jgi:hypothetical protein
MKLNARAITISIFIAFLIGMNLSSSANVSAQYYPISTNQLTVITNYNGAGYVYPGNGSYYYGSTVTPRVYTNPGYVFDGWYLNGVYMGKLASMPLTMTQDYTLIAVFSIRTACLTITNNPSEGGTTAPAAGIWNYTYGSTITIREYPNSGASFSGWYLDGEYQGAGTSITITMNQDHQLGAFFAGTFPTATPSPTLQPNATSTPTPTPEPGLQVPSLSFYCASSTTTTGFRVEINGALAFNQTGIAGEGITFSYSANNGSSWHDLAYLITGNVGNFSAVWMPSASGNYIVKGTWQSDGVYASITTTVNFAVTPTQNQNTFSVSSNSTLSSLTFDSTHNTFSFSVSGAAGTYGYVQACIPKSLLPVVANLEVLLDGNNVDYYTFSQNDIWIITIMYHHSTHTVVMALDGTQATNSPTTQPTANPTQSSTSASNPTSNPTTAPTPTITPTIPELTAIIVLPLLIALISAAVFRQQKKQQKTTTT